MTRTKGTPKSAAELKKYIMFGVVEVYNQKGLKFTMDDIAKELKMSKKTIYKLFDTKDELFLAMVDMMFDEIKDSEEAIVRDESLSTYEKISKILGVLPDSYSKIDFSKLNGLREKYPEVYSKVEERLETGWETTIDLLEKGMKEGCIRQVDIPIVKMMFEASLEQFFQRDILVRNRIGYVDAINEVVGIIMGGIRKN